MQKELSHEGSDAQAATIAVVGHLSPSPAAGQNEQNTMQGITIVLAV